MLDQGLIDADKLAQITGQSVRTVREHGRRRKWSQKRISRRGKGGINVKYEAEGIDPEYKAPYFQEKILGYSSPLILPKTKELNEDKSKALLDRYEKAPGWCKQKAVAREEIIKCLEIFSSKNKKRISSCKPEFAGVYNSRNSSINISDDTYNLINKISKRRLNDWLRNYAQEGLAGLIPSPDRGKPKSKVYGEILAYLLGLIKNNPGIRAVRAYEYLQNKFSGTVFPIPCYRTVLNFFKNWKTEEKELYCHMQNPDKHRSQFQAAFGNQSQKAEYFLHVIEFDSTPSDVQCSDGKRYKISAAIDIFSRKVKFVVVPTHNSVAIVNTLLRLIILRYGIPSVAIFDNGKEYVSNHTINTCHILNIKPEILPPFSPELKPHVERVIGSLAVFLEELPGFIGHSIQQRKNIEARKSFSQRMFTEGEIIECGLASDGLQEAIDTWTDKIYHQRIHSELGMSPEQKASLSPRKAQKIKDERLLDVLLSINGKRTVLKKGISFEGGRFASPELAEHMGKKVQIRIDLTNAGKIFVFDTESKFICVARDLALEPFTAAEAREARRRQRLIINEKEKAMRVLAEPIGNPMLELLEAKRRAPGQIRAFIPEESFENEHTVEARKALDAENAEPVSTFVPDFEIEEKSEKIIHLLKKKEDDFFESELERYKFLQKKEPCEHTEKDRLFMKRYEQSDEYNFLFRMLEQQSY